MNLLQRLSAVEKISRTLDPSPRDRQNARQAVLDYTETFLDQISSLPAYRVTDDKGAGILQSTITEGPTGIGTLMREFGEHIDRPGLNPASGGHLGYIPGGGVYYSSLGDYLAAVTNRYAGVFYASPGAVRLEEMLLGWMRDIVGFPSSSGGNLTSGGSIANLVGIVAARDAAGLKARDFDRSVIYLTQQAHHSVDKAVRIAGLGESVLRHVPVDTKYRMSASALEEAVARDRKAGLHPWLVIAAAGTTDAGAVDPLDAIGDIAKRNNLWLHVDGAYGAFFVLTDEGKKILRGMEMADSLVMDPHKGLFLPYGSGAVLLRDRKNLFNAFWYQANYLADAQKAGDELSPADLSPELTKHFRGLRLWLPLKLHGLAPFRAALEEKILLARYFHEEVGKIPGCEVGPYPDLSVVTYRFVPKRGDADEANAQIVQDVMRDGRVFISSTRLDNKFILRLAVLAFRTHKETVDILLDILRTKSKEMC
jgi:aromatic-L-amino-acid decarboxylase